MCIAVAGTQKARRKEFKEMGKWAVGVGGLPSESRERRRRGECR